MFYFTKYFFFLTSLSFLFACGNASKNPEISKEEILPKEKMAAVLTDLALMQSSIDMNTVRPAPKDSNLVFNIYKQHEISRQEYDASINYYSKHVEEFREVYVLVLAKLEAMKKEK